MNYNKIVSEGFMNPSTSKNLKVYFIRQYKNAKNEHYSLDEFFDGCLNEIQLIEDDIEFQFQERNGRLALALDKAEFEKSSKGIETIKEAMKSLKRDYFSRFNINYSQSQYIKKQIQEAMLTLQPKKNTKRSNIEPLNFELNQSEVIYLFDILQAAGFLKQPILHDGSYYRKLETYFTASKIPIKDSEQKRQKYLDKPLKTSIKNDLIRALEKF